MLAVNVQGGTGAGRKRPLKEQPKTPWLCDCKRNFRHPAHLARCSRCRKDRP